MKLSSIGILLLTAMVATKYFISSSNGDMKDGSFKEGISFDLTPVYLAVNDMKAVRQVDKLLAFNSFHDVNTDQHTLISQVSSAGSQEGVDYNSVSQPAIATASYTSNEEEDIDDDPIAMEYSNSLVLYDVDHPSHSLIASTYEETDNATPLDNGNTVVSGMMMLMPRK